VSSRAYSAYKISTIDWIEKLPRDWSEASLKRLFRIYGGSTPSSNEENWGGEIAWFTPADLSQVTSMYLGGPNRHITRKGLDSCGAPLVPGGSIILSTRAPIGSSAIILHEAATNQGCKALVPARGVNSEYYAYLLSVLAEYLQGLGKGTTFLELSRDALGTVGVPLPSEEEQREIAAFLDDEITKIDALIEEQQRLIELLEEKRQAVISHAVTKGLDPDAPMKDSGVEWLGEVPAHWSIARIKHITLSRGGSTPSKENLDYWNGAIPWVSPKDMKQNEISDSIDHVTDAAIRETGLGLIEPNSVLIVVRGMILDHSIPVALTEVPVTINQDMKALTAGESIDPGYLLILLTGLKQVLFEFVDSSAHGTKTFQWERFQNLDVPLPPLQEQRKICRQLAFSSKLIERLLKEANRSIQILSERRSALISAAVTGKIDVRNWQSGVGAPEPLPMAAEAPATYEDREQ